MMERSANQVHFEYVDLGPDELDIVSPLWKKLLEHHVAVSRYFGGQRSRITFDIRKKQLLEKSHSGGLRIDMVRDTQTGNYVGYCITSINAEKVGEIESIYLEPEYRRSRIGDGLMKRALSWLESRSPKRMILGVAEGNERFSLFTAGMGFIPGLLFSNVSSRKRAKEISEMNPEAMKPFGTALIDYYQGNKEATISTIRDDGWESQLPASIYFRPAQSLDMEKMALDLCRGHIMDAGAGTGIHSRFLKEKGLRVYPIDVSPEAVKIMKESGLTDVQEIDIFALYGLRFDTILMLGHGIGMVENITGLRLFLDHVKSLLKTGGQILLTSLEYRATDEQIHLEYQKRNLREGRYGGEIRMRFKYGDMVGPLFGWLQVAPETLMCKADRAGWRCEVIKIEKDGNYLARLSVKRNE